MPLTEGAPLANITTTQGQTTTAPTWYTDYLSDAAKNVTAQTTGPNAAQYVGAQPLQEQAYTATGALPGTYQPSLQSGLALTNTVGSTDVAKRAGEFMNPYTQNVVDSMGALGQRNIQQFLAPQATSAAVGSGQFGSKRGAEVLGQAINTGLQNINYNQGQALQTGYTQALQAAQADQQNKLAAGNQMGSLATVGQNLDLADINALSTMGAQQQTIKQNEEMFPLETINKGAQALRGYSIPTSVSSTYTGPIPGAYAASPLQQIAGLGAVVAGAGQTDFGKAVGSGLSKAWGQITNPFKLDSANVPAGYRLDPSKLFMTDSAGNKFTRDQSGALTPYVADQYGPFGSTQPVDPGDGDGGGGDGEDPIGPVPDPIVEPLPEVIEEPDDGYDGTGD
jgi:hypothetical protein